MRRPRSPVALLRNAYHSLGRVEREVQGLAERLERVEGTTHRLGRMIRGIAADDARNRAALEAVRSDPAYELAWSEQRPLVSVAVATFGRRELTELSLPSVLDQSYGELELIVAAHGTGAETEERVRALGDERIRYLDLGPRITWSDSVREDWLAGDARPRNAATAAATGRWVVCFDDDDRMRPESIELLLELAREQHAEAAYGQVRAHRGEGWLDFCAYPPRENHFSWLGGMYHSGLRFFEREPVSADLDVPGDWWLAERMLRAGVRFAMRDEVLCDHYPADTGRGRD